MYFQSDVGAAWDGSVCRKVPWGWIRSARGVRGPVVVDWSVGGRPGTQGP